MDDTSRPPGSRFTEFVDLIRRLRAPGGCPWDREQTHRSLKAMTIEEAYEVLEAIDEGDDGALADELGDLLLQVVFHSAIAAEEGRFTIDDVVERVSDKMVRRHPHVFGDGTADTPDEVLRNWEALKAAERREAGKEGPGASSMMDSVSASLPAVIEAFQMTTKAGRVGFDWASSADVIAKLDEEARELKAAIAEGSHDPRAVEEEVGDLLFVAVNLARALGADPESALKAANRKFRRRFRYIEDRLRERGAAPASSTLAEMDGLWNEAKARERGTTS
jgi:tetrapyrrole methylase family protein / MazG family protein